MPEWTRRPINAAELGNQRCECKCFPSVSTERILAYGSIYKDKHTPFKPLFIKHVADPRKKLLPRSIIFRVILLHMLLLLMHFNFSKYLRNYVCHTKMNFSCYSKSTSTHILCMNYNKLRKLKQTYTLVCIHIIYY